MKFPDHFPAECPPPDARLAEGKVYRLVCRTPPTSADFRSWWHMYPGRKWTTDKECEACGLSVLSDKNDALAKLLRRSPYGRKQWVAVAELALTPSCGRLMATPSNNSRCHCTWWVHEGFDPMSTITAVVAVPEVL